MKISLNWIREFVDLPIDETLSHLNNVVVGYVEKLEQHPDADKLKIATVNVGSETKQIICGGTNLEQGMHVPVALPGAILPGNFEIKKAKLRGIESDGMICHLSELGLAKDEDKKISPIPEAKPGTPFINTLDKKEFSPEQIGELLTLKTAEVEEVKRLDTNLAHVYTGQLKSVKKITDQHHHAKFDLGDKEIELVFGSVFELEVGMILPIATEGAVMSNGLVIKPVQMHGVTSNGMVCSDEELGISNSESGLTVFPEGTPLGLPVAEVLGLNDVQLDIDNKSVTHRPDLWNHYGYARELSAITGTKLKKQEFKPQFPKSGETPTIKVETPEVVKQFAFCIIKNVTVQESPQWLKSRLLSIGINPVNNIVDITNYVPWEMGQPLHAYDRELSGDTIILRKAKDGEILETIDHKERKLSSDDYIIANPKEPLLINGIMGGAKSEIRDETTEVLLESAVWDATIVRKASQRIGLRTDASARYEKDLDPNQCLPGLIRAVELILQVCPDAELAGPAVEEIIRPLKEHDIELDPTRVNKYLGIDINSKDMLKILESLEFKVSVKKDKLLVTVPTFRATKDVTREEDLIEEIGRIHGYDQIQPKHPELPTQMPMLNMTRRREHQARQILQSFDVNEVFNYSFYSEKNFHDAFLEEKDHLKLKNFLSEEQTHLRTSLLPNILKNIHKNTNNFEEIQIFEIGRTYLEIGEYFPAEETKIALAVRGSNAFLKLKGILTEFFHQFSHQEFNFNIDTNPPKQAHPNKAANITDEDDNTLANAYIVHPLILENFDLANEEVAYAEINFGRLTHSESHVNIFDPIPKFPDTSFDLSILADKKTPASTLVQAIEQTSDLIHDVQLFDIYEGEHIPADKKALAYTITLRADRTLTDQETTQVQQDCIANLAKVGGEVRGG